MTGRIISEVQGLFLLILAQGCCRLSRSSEVPVMDELPDVLTDEESEGPPPLESSDDELDGVGRIDRGTTVLGTDDSDWFDVGIDRADTFFFASRTTRTTREEQS